MSYVEAISEKIEKIVVESNIEDYLKEYLYQVETTDDLVQFFQQFTAYNQPFPGAVSHLVAAIHFSSSLFEDSESLVNETSDRSSLIASGIFFAAEDEYALDDRNKRLTHRTMGQQVLNHTIQFAGWTPEKFNVHFKSTANKDEMFRSLCEGYGVGNLKADENLFSAIGFHLGSERLADIEFNQLHRMLVKKHPEFVKSCKASIGAFEIPSYSWIASHMTAEVEHFEHGLIAASDAIKFYSGTSKSPDELMELLMVGFGNFIVFQRKMFS